MESAFTLLFLFLSSVAVAFSVSVEKPYGVALNPLLLQKFRLKRSTIVTLPPTKFDGSFEQYKNGFHAPKKSKGQAVSLEEEANRGSVLTVDRDGSQKLHSLLAEELKVFQEAAALVQEERANGRNCEDCKGPFEEVGPQGNSQEAEGNEPAGTKSRKMNTTSILGSDTRTEVLTANWVPARQSGLLTFSGGWCTAALIGPRHILTAGHCVHQGNGGSWYGGFRFYPGRTRLSTTPYTSYGWSSISTYTGWTQNGDYDWDIALITLSSATTFGWLSFGWSSSISTSWYINHKGYPQDKSYGSMWSSDGYICDVDDHVLWTDTTDTVGGQSGGPWYRYVSSNPVVYAAHSGSYSWWFFGWNTQNRHTRITSGVFNDLCSWIADSNVC